ncbi:hypothetical protein GCK32_020619, partial [Trichostrongylus colubriformis]
MTSIIITIPYQVFYTVIPTISIIGNFCIVYVTMRSRSLRSPCAILIGLISSGDIMHMLGHYVTIVSYNLGIDVTRREHSVEYTQLAIHHYRRIDSPECLYQNPILQSNKHTDRPTNLRTNSR